MAKEEELVPITEEEMDDIRVTLELEDGPVVCRILSIFEVEEKDYIALVPLDKDGNDNAEGEVYLYRYSEDAKGIPSIEYISDEEESETVADCFEEMMDEELYDSMD